MTPAGPSIVRQVALFAGLSEDDLLALEACLRRRRYGKGEVVFLRGDPGSALFLIEEGTVKISLTSPEGREVILALLDEADFFGELALLDGQPRSADAVAMAPSQLLLLPREDFLVFLERRPGVTTSLLAVLSQRLRRDTEIVQDAAFLDVPARLAKAILHLADARGTPGDGGVVIESRLTQAELAGMVGATRESVNKWLGFFERHGMIHYDRGRITVLRPDGLRQRVDPA